jgi:hypothetical protein
MSVLPWATMLADIDGSVVTTVYAHGRGAASTRWGCRFHQIVDVDDALAVRFAM